MQLSEIPKKLLHTSKEAKMKLKKTITLYELSLKGSSYAKSTRIGYMDTLMNMKNCIGNIKLEKIDIWELRKWQADINLKVETQKLSIWSLHKHTRAVQRFFRWCVEEGFIEYSPADRLPLPKLPMGEAPKNISDENLEILLNAARKKNPRDYAIIRFLADTGCRRGGIAGLKLEDVNLDRFEAVVREKGHKTRTVFYGQETANAMRKYLEARPKVESNRFFIGRQGPLSDWGIRQVIRRLTQETGIKGRTNPHSFRHAWARRAIAKGMDLGRVSKILGHSDIRVTHLFYACWTQDELKSSHHVHDTMCKFDKTENN